MARAGRAWPVLLALALGLPQDPPVPAPSGQGERREPETGAEWNENGVAALREGRHDEAIAAFQRARELLPGDPTVAVNLARAYAFRGRARLDAGRVLEALADFQSGAEADRDGGALETLVAETEVRLGRRESAQGRLDAVLRDFPGHLPARQLAAELAALEGDLGRAIHLLEAAADPPPEVSRRLEQLREERRAFEGFLTDSSAHFDYRYDPARQEIVESVPLLIEDLEDAYQLVAVKLGLAPADRVLVLVLDRERYRGGAPAWSSGLYDGRIRLAVGDYRREREALRATLRHEYAHAALHRIGPPLPTWLHEGLSQWVEGRSVVAARRALKQGAALPDWASLDGNWTAWTDRARVQLAYDYALSLCAYLGEAYGAAVYRLLFDNVRSLGFDAGAERTFGKPLAQVDAEHRRMLAE